MSVHDVFDDLELQEFNAYLESKESVTETTDGYKYLSLPEEKDDWEWVLFGLVIPGAILLLVFGVLKYLQTGEDPIEDDKDSEEREELRKSEDPFEDNEDSEEREELRKSAGDKAADGGAAKGRGLFANKARPLFTLIVVMLSTLAVAFLVAGLINYAVAKKNPDWKYKEYEHPLHDSYLAGGTLVTATAPQNVLSDTEFNVYIGWVTWTTVVCAGLGVEIFVWHHFLQFWSNSREGLWKFAQFVFPVLSMTSLGLAAHQNFLALLVLVPCLWKFGFPETVMHLYLGIFNKKAARLERISDMCNGIGTLLHHGAASFIISMMVVGVIPPSRYIFNPISILVMQHWVVLLSYVSIPLYSAIELMLEYYFEWIILSDWQRLYHLHWTAALGGSVMLFAHWLYLGAAGAEMFIQTEVNDMDTSGGDVSSGAKANPANVHERGILAMSHQAPRTITVQTEASVRDFTAFLVEQMEESNPRRSSSDPPERRPTGPSNGVSMREDQLRALPRPSTKSSRSRTHESYHDRMRAARRCLSRGERQRSSPARSSFARGFSITSFTEEPSELAIMLNEADVEANTIKEVNGESDDAFIDQHRQKIINDVQEAANEIDALK